MKSSANIKIEKKSLWFSDIILTAKSVADNAREGWHLCDIELVKGQFTYKKGEKENYYYWFQTSNSKENLSIFSDEDFEKVFDKNAVALWRRKEIDPACIENVNMSFRDLDSVREENWLNEQAKEGFFLLRTSRPEYTFEVTESMDLTYKIVYEESVEDTETFLAPYTNAGWDYVWGNNGYHYFVSETISNADQSVFNTAKTSTALLKRRKTVFNTFLIFSIGLLVFSLIITGINLNNYMGLDEILDAEKITSLSTTIAYNFGAIAISVLFTLTSLFLKVKTSRQIKNLK